MPEPNDYYTDGLNKNFRGLYKEAVVAYSKAIEADPSFRDAWMKRGTIRYKVLKQYEGAIDDFNRVIQLEPQFAQAYLHRGIVKCHLLKFDDAIPDYDKAIELDPNDERAYINRGKTKFMLKYPKAEVLLDLEKAIFLGAPHAADLVGFFFGRDNLEVKEAIAKGLQQKREQLKNS